MAKRSPAIKRESKKEREMALIENGGKINGQLNCVNCVCCSSGEVGEVGNGSLLSMFCGLKQRKKHPKSNLMS